MKAYGPLLLLAWWLYTWSPSPSGVPAPTSWVWLPRERFLHQEFCELNARRLRSEGLQARCLYVED